MAAKALQEATEDVYDYIEALGSTFFEDNLILSGAMSLNLEAKKSAANLFTIKVVDRNFDPKFPLFEVKNGRSRLGYTTTDLIKLNARVKEAMDEVLRASI